MIKICLSLSMLFTMIIPSLAQLPSVLVEREQTSNGWVDKVTNKSPYYIAAFDAKYKCNGRLLATYRFDPALFYGHDSPIRPGGTFTFGISPKVATCEVGESGVVAVIFSDGHTEGDSGELEEIRQRRQGALDELNRAITVLDGATSTFDSARAASDLERRKNAILPDNTLSMASRDGRIFVLHATSERLRKQDDLYVPSDSTSSRGKSIDQVMRDNNVSRETAHAIVLDRKLHEWAAALKTQDFPTKTN